MWNVELRDRIMLASSRLVFIYLRSFGLATEEFLTNVLTKQVKAKYGNVSTYSLFAWSGQNSLLDIEN